MKTRRFLLMLWLLAGVFAGEQQQGMAQNQLPKGDSLLLGADRAKSAPMPFEIFAKGRLEAGENKHWKLRLPGGRVEFLADVRRVDKLCQGVTGELEIIRSETDEGEDSVLSSKFKEPLTGWRVALNLETSPKSPAVLLLANHSPVDVDFWIYVLRPTTAKVPPLYGEIVPPLLLPDNLPKITLKPGETGFCRVRLPKGKSLLYGDFERGGKPGQLMQAEARLLGPHAEPVNRKPDVISQETAAYRAAFTYDFEQAVYAVISVTNRGECDFTYQMTMPSASASLPAAQSSSEPKTPPILKYTDVAPNQKFTKVLAPGEYVLLRFKAVQGNAKVIFNVAGSLKGSGRLTLLDENKLTAPTDPLVVEADQEPRLLTLPLTFKGAGDFYLKLENTGKSLTGYGVVIEAEE